ncbi:hypothetical protein BBSC_1029 [Bifidobacterium scardovii JCM 12489 = DSM 13734]|nr:hypothetical protein BBSC_1029 [Bifidobacterium scardovii JCM 12489 = DSM 13734]
MSRLSASDHCLQPPLCQPREFDCKRQSSRWCPFAPITGYKTTDIRHDSHWSRLLCTDNSPVLSMIRVQTALMSVHRHRHQGHRHFLVSCVINSTMSGSPL